MNVFYLFFLVTFIGMPLAYAHSPNHKCVSVLLKRVEKKKIGVRQREKLSVFLSKNLNKYPLMDGVNIFLNKEFVRRVKKLLSKTLYTEMKAKFNTQSPIVAVDSIYKITACQAHNCMGFNTTFYYDALADNLNIHIEKNNILKKYEEKGAIILSQTLIYK